jgi:hypothetical protein
MQVDETTIETIVATDGRVGRSRTAKNDILEEAVAGCRLEAEKNVYNYDM